MSINPLNDISKVYLEQVVAVEEGVRPTPVDKPLDKTAFKKRRRSLAGKEKRAEARGRGHEGKEWYNSGRTYSPDEAKRMRSKLDDAERRTRHRSAVDPDSEDDNNYSADKTKNPKKIRKQKAMGELGESAVPGKPAERVGAVTAIPKSEQDAARERTLAKAKAMREKRGIKEAAKPDYLDFDKDGNEKESMKKALKDKKNKKIEEAKKEKPKRWWDNDGDGIGYEKGEVSGKFKKKSVKEGYSNWRQDLSEVMTDTESEKKVTEKKVNNKIDINPKLDLGETVENLGGTLLEMVEIDEIDYVVESVYDELLEEGYEEDDIEEALEFALTEATVTFGHDTSTGATGKKKGGNLVAAVGRLARQKLSSKVRGAKKAAKQAVATGARKVAKGALGVARKMEGGDKKPSTVERKPSTYRGAGAGQKERVSSGSYTAPTKKKADKPSDPWKGSSTVPQKPKPKPKADKPSDPWEGSATTPTKPKAKKVETKKTAAPKTPAATAKKRKRKSKLDSLLSDIRSEQTQISEKTLTSVETKEKERIVKSMKSKAGDFEKRYPGRGKEVMYATATKLAKRIAEQAMEIQPKGQQSNQSAGEQKKVGQQRDKQRQQEVQILQRKLQALRSAPKGVDTDITA